MRGWVVFLLFLAVCLSPTVKAAPVESFQIVPNLLYTDDDVKVIFSAKAGAGEAAVPVISLLELDSAGEKVRFIWPLTDDGSQGDLIAGDGLYSRKIQFKEKRPKKITFLVAPIPPGTFETDKTPPIVPPSQTAVLEIRPRPTFLEILRDVFRKIWAEK